MTETVETVIAGAGIVHMDNFLVINTVEPATASWKDYSPLEQGKAKLAALAIIAALDTAGFKIVPKEPPNTEHTPGAYTMSRLFSP